MKGILFFVLYSLASCNEQYFEAYLQLNHSLPNDQLLFSLDENRNLLVFLPFQHQSDVIPLNASAFKTLRILRISSLRIPEPWNLILLQQIAGKNLYPDMTGPIKIVINRDQLDTSYLEAVRKNVQPIADLGKQFQVLDEVVDVRYKGSTFSRINKMSLTADFLRRGLAILDRQPFSGNPLLLTYYEGLEKKARDQQLGIWNRLSFAALKKRLEKIPNQP